MYRVSPVTSIGTEPKRHTAIQLLCDDLHILWGALCRRIALVYGCKGHTFDSVCNYSDDCDCEVEQEREDNESLRPELRSWQ